MVEIKKQVCVYYKPQMKECTFRDNNYGNSHGLSRCEFSKDHRRCPIWKKYKSLRGLDKDLFQKKRGLKSTDE